MERNRAEDKRAKDEDKDIKEEAGAAESSSAGCSQRVKGVVKVGGAPKPLLLRFHVLLVRLCDQYSRVRPHPHTCIYRNVVYWRPELIRSHAAVQQYQRARKKKHALPRNTKFHRVPAGKHRLLLLIILPIV